MSSNDGITQHTLAPRDDEAVEKRAEIHQVISRHLRHPSLDHDKFLSVVGIPAKVNKKKKSRPYDKVYYMSMSILGCANNRFYS